MPSSFKKSLQGFLATVRSSVMEKGSNISLDGPLKKILGHQDASTWADVAFSNVVKSDNGPALLSALQSNYRISKASHFKKRPRLVFQDVVEHEFVVVHIRCKNKVTLFRIDRCAGHQSEPKNPSSTTASSEKSSPSVVPSHINTQSSISICSLGFASMAPSRMADYCVCRLRSSYPNRHCALDTIVEIPELPSPTEAYELKTIEFTGSSSVWPSLWDLIHTLQFLNQQSEEYDPIDAQCYWYADMVSALLEGWCPDTKVTSHRGWQGTKSKTLDIPEAGTIKGVPIYKRNPQIVEERRCLLLETMSSIKSTMELLDTRNGRGDQVSEAQVKERAEGEEREERVEARERAEDKEREEKAKAAKERAEAKEMAERAEERAKQVEERAERAEERAKQAEERAERAEEKAREADAKIQDLVKKFEARVGDSDALLARMFARLDDLKSHGLGPSITA